MLLRRTLEKLGRAGYVHVTGICYSPSRGPETSIAICLNPDYAWKWGQGNGLALIVTADGQVWIRDMAIQTPDILQLEEELREELCRRGGACPVPFSKEEIASAQEQIEIRRENPYKDILALPTTTDYMPERVAEWPEAILVDAVA
ncbi:MAG: hypothetical protein PHV93_00115 [Candidatus Pacebacteria bacterium]|nr:hypothetical protein [Candidatus Paceibacterota bacterium]